MWIFCTFISAFFIGLQDIASKQALKDNSVFGVLLLNLLFCTIFFAPIILSAQLGLRLFEGTWFDIPTGNWYFHTLVFIKALIVLFSWLSLYFSLKYLPITLTAPIKAMYPVLTLIGALVIFHEHLNIWQWLGIFVSLFSLVQLKRSGAKEGIFFAHNKWIWLLGISALFSAASGLYDKFLMQRVHFIFVQSWYTLYQFLFMFLTVSILQKFSGKDTNKLHWKWSILLVSACMIVSEFFYLYALHEKNVMISMVSMMRRSSVLITFIVGAVWFREKNIRSKSIDLMFVIIGMILLGVGSYLQNLKAM